MARAVGKAGPPQALVRYPRLTVKRLALTACSFPLFTFERDIGDRIPAIVDSDEPEQTSRARSPGYVREKART